MKMFLSIVALVGAMCAGSAYAEGLPSQSKLSKLGLSSMRIANDHEGLEARGRGFGGLQITFSLAAFDPALTGSNSALASTIASTFGQAPRNLGAVVGADLGFGIATPDATTGLATGASGANFIDTPLRAQVIISGVLVSESVVGGFLTARAR